MSSENATQILEAVSKVGEEEPVIRGVITLLLGAIAFLSVSAKCFAVLKGWLGKRGTSRSFSSASFGIVSSPISPRKYYAKASSEGGYPPLPEPPSTEQRAKVSIDVPEGTWVSVTMDGRNRDSGKDF